MLPGLNTLLQPLGLRQFRQQFWHQHHYVARARRNLLVQLARELEDFDVERLLARHSGVVQAWVSTPERGFNAAEIPREAGPVAYDAGATLYLRLIDVPALAGWQSRLARELGHSPQGLTCSVFAAKRGAGTRCHFDTLENFTIQLQGTKTWHLLPNRHVKAPLENWVTGDELTAEMELYCKTPMPKDMPGRAKRIELQPGDVLYLPRGYWHSAAASRDSLSLFLGFPVTPCVDFILNALRSRLIRSAPWRESFIDPNAGPQWRMQARRQVQELLGTLAADVSQLTTDDIVTRVSGH
jgi:ribosomal protein L16 Arg81 hydroxylase